MSTSGLVRRRRLVASFDEIARHATAGDIATWTVRICSRAEVQRSAHWARAFARERRDHRYYEIVEDTIRQDFEYRYFAIEDKHGEIHAVQPFFLLDQDLLQGVGPNARKLAELTRRAWPRFMRVRTLMLGCAVGEGHLDDVANLSQELQARLLASAIIRHARELKAPLIVLKEFSAKYRAALECFIDHGFTRVPSLPMTKLNIDYASFDDYARKALNSATRRKLRKKFETTARAAPIHLSIVDDVTPIADDLYPLYLQVYHRSKLHFEKLTKEYLCRIGQQMSDRTRFFIWQQQAKIVAFSLCMIEGDSLYAEYVGFDYSVALDLHLYHYAVRDMITWAITNGYKWFRSSALIYDPKLHLRHQLDPIDLYVRHTSPIANLVLKLVLPLIEPTRGDETLKKFPNYHDLWGDADRGARGK